MLATKFLVVFILREQEFFWANSVLRSFANVKVYYLRELAGANDGQGASRI